MAKENQFGEVRKFGKEVLKTRTIPFVFSDETRDSYGTVIPVANWDLDRFNKSGVAFYQHNSYSSDPDNLIGKARAWVENGKLLGEIAFEPADVNEKADKIFRKIVAGTMKAVSVGFIPVTRGEWGKGDEAAGGSKSTYYYGKCELLEISVVNIPANKNALTRSVGFDPDKEFEESEQKEVKDRICYRMAEFDVKLANEEEREEKKDQGRTDDESEKRILALANAELAV